jgi:hypothetical protein
LPAASPTGRVEVVEVQAPEGGKPPPPDVPTASLPALHRTHGGGGADRHRVASTATARHRPPHTT